MPCNYRIGIDFDNTIICYDDLFHKLAVQNGLIEKKIAKTKKSVRARVRATADGEMKWQELQGKVYGPMIFEAKLKTGVSGFFKQCNFHNIDLFIVSHKTEFAGMDPTKTNLQKAALNWMEQQGFFQKYAPCIARKRIFFENTRKDKIRRIIKIGCTHFIDDLEELFLESIFPGNVKKILYAKETNAQTYLHSALISDDWAGIADYFFQRKTR